LKRRAAVIVGVFSAQSHSAITYDEQSPQIEALGVRQRMLHLREKVFPVGRRNLDAERAISSLVGKQSKHSHNYRHSNQSLDDERYNRMSTGPESPSIPRSFAPLRCRTSRLAGAFLLRGNARSPQRYTGKSDGVLFRAGTHPTGETLAPS
jgi:hypothetical protein